MNYIIALLQEGLQLAGAGFQMILSSILGEPEPTHNYTASFIDSDEILSKDNSGFCMDGKKSLLRKAPNAMVIAPSGAGKSTVVCIPTLLRIDGSVICNDPSGELYDAVSGYLYQKGYAIKVLNFSSMSGHGFNPLLHIRNTADAQKIAGILVRTVLPHANDPFWSIAASGLISLAIRILLYYETQYRNFANVRHLLQLMTFDPGKVDKLVVGTKAQDIINDYKSFLAQDLKLRTSIVATANAALQIFSDPIVAKVTSIDTLELEELRMKKTIVFIHSNTTDLKYYSPLISIFFEQVMKLLMSKLPQEDDHYVFFILDELSSLYLPSLEVAVSNIRKYRGSLLLILQTYQSLLHIYGKESAEAIKTNCFARLYFAGQDHKTSEELSKQLGRYTWIEEDGTRRNTRELMTADEIRTMDRNTAILICGSLQPMKIPLAPYYEQPMLTIKTNLPACDISRNIDDHQISYISV